MAETTISFKVLGMTCTMCALTIEKQLSDQVGVMRAAVNFALAHATVTYDPDKIAPKQLAQAIRDVGYNVDIERTELDIAGIMCVACITAIENSTISQHCDGTIFFYRHGMRTANGDERVVTIAMHATDVKE